MWPQASAALLGLSFPFCQGGPLGEGAVNGWSNPDFGRGTEARTACVLYGHGAQGNTVCSGPLEVSLQLTGLPEATLPPGSPPDSSPWPPSPGPCPIAMVSEVTPLFATLREGSVPAC